MIKQCIRLACEFATVNLHARESYLRYLQRIRKRGWHTSSHINSSSTKPLDTGWQRCIGSLKLQVSSRQRAINYKGFMRKVTNEDKASYASSPPCMRSTPATGLHDSDYLSLILVLRPSQWSDTVRYGIYIYIYVYIYI